MTEQYRITKGRIVVAGQVARRREALKADYLLKYTGDFSIAVVEAKAESELAANGVQQAIQYAQMLGLSYAYSTNGHDIIEIDLTSGFETNLSQFPTPEDLWHRLNGTEPLDADQTSHVLAPIYSAGSHEERYYQQIAINRTVEAIVRGQKRVLLVMATGTGKTPTAFQICWKLWSTKWNARNDPTRKPRILYLADRTVLVDDPKDKTFAPFGDARGKIERGNAIKSRELYFATYQAIAEDESRPGLYKEYAPDFFDLIIIDECHRGSAREDSVWRDILEYFEPAFQLGLTATPVRRHDGDSYDYFGDPIYTYSLKQGIEDGFLAPYRVHRIVTHYDAVGYRPSQGELDRLGQAIPDGEYSTKDFERTIALQGRMMVENESFGFNFAAKGSLNQFIAELEIDGLTPNLNKSGFVERDDQVFKDLGREVLKECGALIKQLREGHDEKILGREKKTAKRVRGQLKTMFKHLAEGIGDEPVEEQASLSGEGNEGRKPREPRERDEQDSDKSKSEKTGRENKPKTTAPDGAVGTLRRLMRRLKNGKDCPEIEIVAGSPDIRSALVEEDGKVSIQINKNFPGYAKVDGADSYVAETVLIELLMRDEECQMAPALVERVNYLLVRWSGVASNEVHDEQDAA